jgi:hypothetical protein
MAANADFHSRIALSTIMSRASTHPYYTLPWCIEG